MNVTELTIEQQLEQDGWIVFRNGMPDFMCYREDGDKPKLKFVEVKSYGNVLTLKQKMARTCLMNVGIEVEVICCGEDDAPPLTTILASSTYSKLKQMAIEQECSLADITAKILMRATDTNHKEKKRNG